LPPYSTLRTFVHALQTGDTNITRVLTTLMQYPSNWQPDTGNIEVNPLSDFLKGLFKQPGMMKDEEIAHIEDAWPMAQKQELREHVVQAIASGRPMVFKWAATSGPAPETDIVWPPANTPLHVPIRVTFRSPSSGFVFSGEEGNEDDIVVTT
jgi:hypothetical protein